MASEAPSGGQKAEDGKTPIAPEKGIMAGRGITAKNKRNQTKQIMSSLLALNKTKTRWYVLDGKTLTWARGREEAPDPEEGDSLQMSRVIDIRPMSLDPDLIKATHYHFDIVTETRVFSIAVESEEQRVKWLVALRYTHTHTPRPPTSPRFPISLCPLSPWARPAVLSLSPCPKVCWPHPPPTPDTPRRRP